MSQHQEAANAATIELLVERSQGKLPVLDPPERIRRQLALESLAAYAKLLDARPAA